MLDGSVAVAWLLRSHEPAVRRLALVELLDVPAAAPEAAQAAACFFEGAWVQALMAGQQADGGFGVHPYQKWGGAHWRLVSLMELGAPPGDARLVRAAEILLDWLCSPGHRKRIPVVAGLTRRCASQEGNALAVCCRLGLAGDPRVALLATSLLEWQWPDGGWNCDVRPEARHASFHESLIPLWGLIEHHRATASRDSIDGARRAAELFLRHRLLWSDRTGQVINPEWLKLHYPPYWRYDVLQALLVLARGGLAGDERAREGLDLVEAARRPDGTWHADGWHWKAPGKAGSQVEVAAWDRRGPNQMLTLNALRVLKAAGRLAPIQIRAGESDATLERLGRRRG